MKLLLLIFIFSFSCQKKYSEVKILNESSIVFDSAKIEINHYTKKVLVFKPGETKNLLFARDSIDAKHDVVFSLYFYSNGKCINQKRFYSNDLGFVPDNFQAKITDSLIIEY